jgi:hypothetical protein
MKIQEIALGLIVLTVCLAFGFSVVASSRGTPVAPDLQGVLNTAFTALLVAVPAWLTVRQTEKAKQESFQMGMQAQQETYQSAMLRAGK